MFRPIDRVPARVACSQRAPRGCKPASHIVRSGRPNESQEELLRIQGELLRQIEERKKIQRELTAKLDNRAKAQRATATTTVDLDEEYRKTLNKFRQQSSVAQQSDASSSAASPTPSKPPSSPPPAPAPASGPVSSPPRSYSAPSVPSSRAPPTPTGRSAPYAPPSSAAPATPAAAPKPASPPTSAVPPTPTATATSPSTPLGSSGASQSASALTSTPTRPSAPAVPTPNRQVAKPQAAQTPVSLPKAPAPIPAPPVEEAPPPPKEEPPLAGDNVMNVVFVGAECAPWSKTGGLGDVMGSLPKALARRGHRVMVISPRYENYDNAWDSDVRVRYRVWNQDMEVGYFHCYQDKVDFVFVDHNMYHNRQGGKIYEGSREEISIRNTLLCKAALEAVWHVPCGGVTYGDDNTVFVANDWHTAILPVFLQAHYRDYGKMTYARSILTIHNMAYQGRGPFNELDNFEIPENYKHCFFLDDPVGGEHMNIMKAGIITASRVIAVSSGYAWEIQTSEGGWGLHNVLQEQNWKLSGIVNGIDYNVWHPANDTCLDPALGYTTYDETDFIEGKRKNKAALQKELGLPQDPNVPLLGFIGRMDYQKGVDLISESYGWIMSQNVQLVMLGSGREDLENDLRRMENERPNQCKSWVGFSVPMSHRITAAADILLMPSRFEPCGLNQLYAMKYGTVPVVHAVGGLRETVPTYNPFENTGLGWTFDRAEGEPFRHALSNALLTFRDYRDSFNNVALRGMQQDLSWDHAAERYEEMLVAAKYQW